MATYVVFNKDSGEVVHVHRELYMGSDRGERSTDELFKELAELLPTETNLGFVKADDDLRPVRGYRYYVDPSTHAVALVEHHRAERGLRT